MRLVDILTGPQGIAVIENVARSFNIDPAQAKAVLAALVPEFAYAIERNTLNRAGMADVVEALGRMSPERTISANADLSSPSAQELGIGILDTLLGSKDKSRGVAARVARQTGVDQATIKAMLPAAASITMGALAEGTRSQLRDVIGKVPGLAARSPLPLPGEAPDYGSVPDVSDERPNRWPGGGGMSEPEPQRPAGGGTVKRQTPLPIPGNNIPRIPQGQNPYDDLSDVIRKGKVPMPSGGSLGNIIRGILGSLLGYKGGGVLSGVIRVLILRYGMTILQNILRRVFTGR